MACKIGLFNSLAFLKQQVMADPDVTASHLISVQSPAFSLVFLDCFADILMVSDLYAFPFFQLGFTLDAV